MSQNYESLNLAECQDEADRLENQGQGAGDAFLDNFVRMPEKEGFVIVRLLPPAKGKKWFCATRTHRLKKSNLHCPRELSTINGVKRWLDCDARNPCPVCKYYNSLYREADEKEGKEAEALIESAKAIKPIERYYYNCIVRQQVNEKGEIEKNVGPKILSIGKTLHEKIIRIVVGDAKAAKKGLGDVSDIKTGRDFKIVKKIKRGKEAYPYYDESEFLDPSPLGDKDEADVWLENLHDLAALRKLKGMEDMKVSLKKYLGLIPDEDTSFDLNEFKKPAESVAEQSQQERDVVVATPMSPPTGDAVLAEKDFLEELRKVQ
ncbi:hypothetical protein [Nitrospira sp. BLG_2]|uniref:hypothetical protein n=1 Tax=Nitrospira sp. BLG_2 TaxID=3397507 RepID=UPI003B9A8115